MLGLKNYCKCSILYFSFNFFCNNTHLENFINWYGIRHYIMIIFVCMLFFLSSNISGKAIFKSCRMVTYPYNPDVIPCEIRLSLTLKEMLLVLKRFKFWSHVSTAGFFWCSLQFLKMVWTVRSLHIIWGKSDLICFEKEWSISFRKYISWFFIILLYFMEHSL